MIEFDLIVRNKSNCLTKNKFLEYQLLQQKQNDNIES